MKHLSQRIMFLTQSMKSKVQNLVQSSSEASQKLQVSQVFVVVIQLFHMILKLTVLNSTHFGQDVRLQSSTVFHTLHKEQQRLFIVKKAKSRFVRLSHIIRTMQRLSITDLKNVALQFMVQ